MPNMHTELHAALTVLRPIVATTETKVPCAHGGSIEPCMRAGKVFLVDTDEDAMHVAILDPTAALCLAYHIIAAVATAVPLPQHESEA